MRFRDSNHWPMLSNNLLLHSSNQRGVAPSDLLKLRQKGTHVVHMKWALPWLVRSARRAGMRFTFWLGCSSPPQNKIFFTSPYTISLHLSPTPSKLDRQSCRIACLFLSVSAPNRQTQRISWVSQNIPIQQPKVIWLNNKNIYDTREHIQIFQVVSDSDSTENTSHSCLRIWVNTEGFGQASELTTLLHMVCRTFIIFEGCKDSNPECLPWKAGAILTKPPIPLYLATHSYTYGSHHVSRI